MILFGGGKFIKYEIFIHEHHLRHFFVLWLKQKHNLFFKIFIKPQIFVFRILHGNHTKITREWNFYIAITWSSFLSYVNHSMWFLFEWLFHACHDHVCTKICSYLLQFFLNLKIYIYGFRIKYLEILNTRYFILR